MHVILRCIEPHFESTLKNNGKLMARLQNKELSLFPQFLVILQFKKRQTDKRKRKKLRRVNRCGTPGVRTTKHLPPRYKQRLVNH